MNDLRKSPQIEELVIEAVKSRTRGAEDAEIVHVQNPFLDGILYTVTFHQQVAGNEQVFFNRVFLTKKSIKVFGHDEDLLAIVGETHARSFYEVFANTEVVSGIIAVVVTLLIVPSFLISYFAAKEVNAPEWITSGWLLILGFYFGKSSASDNK